MTTQYINIDSTTLYQDPQEGCDLQLPLQFLTCLAKTPRNARAINNLITVLSQCENKWVKLCCDYQPGVYGDFCLRSWCCRRDGLYPQHSYKANQSQEACHAKNSTFGFCSFLKEMNKIKICNPFFWFSDIF